jgi:hypothetical protein
MPSKRKTWPARVYLGRDEHGKQQFHWLGRFSTKRERDDAVARAKIERPWGNGPSSEMTGSELVHRYLTEYEERYKASSADTARYQLGAFREEFGDRPAVSITRAEAKDFQRRAPRSAPQVSAMFAWAIVEEEVAGLVRNPFRGLTTGGLSDAPRPIRPAWRRWRRSGTHAMSSGLTSGLACETCSTSLR